MRNTSVATRDFKADRKHNNDEVVARLGLRCTGHADMHAEVQKRFDTVNDVLIRYIDSGLAQGEITPKLERYANSRPFFDYDLLTLVKNKGASS